MITSRTILHVFTGVSLLLATGARGAETGQAGAAEAKLREALRATLQRVQTAENQAAQLQADKDELDGKNKELQDTLDKANKLAAKQQDEAKKKQHDLEDKIAELSKNLAETRLQLVNTEDDDKKWQTLAQATEAKRAKFEERANQLSQRVALQQTKNDGMYRVAVEILDRYEKFGLGDALTAREPFTGITRVKLQGLFEEYRDKLQDQKIKPAEAKPSETKPEASSDTAPSKSKKAGAKSTPKATPLPSAAPPSGAPNPAGPATSAPPPIRANS